MDFVADGAKYARLQHQLLLAMARSIRDELRNSTLSPDEVRELTERVTSAAAFAVDSCDHFDGSVLPVRAYVSFAGMGIGDDKVVVRDGNPGMDELASYAVEELYELEP